MKILIKSIARKINFFLYGYLLIGCTNGIDNIPLQERYRLAYSLRVCSTMGIFVDNYSKDPFEYTWIISQGISTAEKRDQFVLAIAMNHLDVITNTYRIPSKFIPNPAHYSFEDVSSSCPEIYSKFKRIPF